jgi:putative SOS response-associated peptidase YedK
VLIPGIAAWSANNVQDAAHGFAIITDDAAGGMVDVHDRRPVALTRDDALIWLDPNTAIEDALALLSTPKPESAFVWYQVTPAMGSSRYQLADASEPIA